MTDRQVLLNRIMICDFIMDETALYLDTHNHCQQGLAYFQKYNEMKKAAVEEYVQQYGPLQQDDFSGGKSWTWVDNPWPWEREA